MYMDNIIIFMRILVPPFPRVKLLWFETTVLKSCLPWNPAYLKKYGPHYTDHILRSVILLGTHFSVCGAPKIALVEL